jgi:hypothetical protein
VRGGPAVALRRPAPFLVALLAATAALTFSCSTGRNSTQPALETAPFVELARASGCADQRRRLFVIDEAMVLFERVGSCPDNSYAQTLYGRSPGQVLCMTHDSIAGPMTRCEAGAPRDLFETMTRNPDRPDRGLGPDHKVRAVPI